MKRRKGFVVAALVAVTVVAAIGLAATAASAQAFAVTSTAFKSSGAIPLKYADTQVPGGQNVSLPLEWTGLPKGTRSVALTMVDKTTPDRFLHWLVINIDPADTKLEEGASLKKMPSFTTEFKNGSGKDGYGGPAPPAGPAHEYEITVWALSIQSMGMTDNAGLKEFESFVQGKVVGKVVMTGTFARPAR
ncbi:MAG: YbhB/YbcL family Raf kinase inhibitor-like protein [Acidobacteria bacterium]|nr:YbhB/YbcL family Raf kinase inhibitor-like protein [Acidobacteriota bacterium]